MTTRSNHKPLRNFSSERKRRNLRLIVSPVIVLEVFYVLAKAYAMPRPDAAKVLETLLTSGLVQCEDGGITLDSLRRITSNKISFGDAYLVATAAHAKEELVSFDKGLAVFKEVQLFPLNSLPKDPKK